MSDEEWTTERKFEQFKKEVHDRFVREAEFWRKVYELDLRRAIAENGEAECRRILGDEAMTYDPDRECAEWDLYTNSKISFVDGHIEIVMDSRYVLRPDWINFYEHTSIAWSKVGLKAKQVDGEPRVVLQIMMIDYWDDAKEAEWHATNKWEPDHKYNWQQWYPEYANEQKSPESTTH